MSGASDATPAFPALEVCGLVKDFPVGLRGVRLRAVDRLTLRVAPGEIFGLLGPNGGGKSTTIKAILGLLEPSAGECRIFGRPSASAAARREVGYLPESPHFHRHLSGRELVTFYARMCDVPGDLLAERVNDAIARVGLSDAADRRVGTYSKGMLQRIGLAQAIVHDPRVLILDEPTAGVDPVGAAAMCELVLALKAAGKTILLSSHLLDQVEDICDRVAIIDRGRLVLEGALAELTGAPERFAFACEAMPAEDVAALRAWFAAHGRTLESMEPPRRRLDRIFLERVGGVRDAARATR